MCGIAGFTGQADPDLLRTITNTLAHRGPDDIGLFAQAPVNLGMRRLAIIDPDDGAQPLFSEDGNVVVVFNGEIYNFQSLREELVHHAFSTHCDTEVIVHGYEEWGTGVWAKLNGMFAVALWDAGENTLLLARDRLGQKPLYYTLQNGQLYFGSELKCLHQAGVTGEIDLDSLNTYLTYEYVPGPASIFQNIYKLPPGSWLEFHDGRMRIRTYWDLRDVQEHPVSEADAIGRLDELLEDSVQLRLISDVPLGVFLSGGIDSSALTYYACRNNSEPLRSFSISFADPTFDESRHAELVAESLGTQHRCYRFSDAELLDCIAQTSGKLDEPFADPSFFPTFLLAKHTRREVTVGLSGDGGDELIMGYPNFQLHRLEPFIPDCLAKSMAGILPASFHNITKEYALKRYARSLSHDRAIRDVLWIGAFSNAQKARLLTFEHADVMPSIAALLQDVSHRDLQTKISYWFTKTYLIDDILVKTDRASMYNSLEARTPFLDYRVVEFLFSLPSRLKLHGLTTKYVLKRLLKGRLPASILRRPKKGFGMPVAEWLTGSLKSQAEDLLLDESALKTQGLFDHRFIRELWQQHQSRRFNFRKELWTLFMFQLWYRTWYAP